MSEGKEALDYPDVYRTSSINNQATNNIKHQTSVTQTRRLLPVNLKITDISDFESSCLFSCLAPRASDTQHTTTIDNDDRKCSELHIISYHVSIHRFMQGCDGTYIHTDAC